MVHFDYFYACSLPVAVVQFWFAQSRPSVISVLEISLDKSLSIVSNRTRNRGMQASQVLLLGFPKLSFIAIPEKRVGHVLVPHLERGSYGQRGPRDLGSSLRAREESSDFLILLSRVNAVLVPR